MTKVSFEEAKLDSAFRPKLISRLLSYIKPYRRQFAFALVASLVIAGIEVVFPLLEKHLVDGLTQAHDNRRISNLVWQIACAYFALLVLRFLINFAQTWVLQVSGQKIMSKLRQDTFEHMLRLPFSFFNKNPVGRLVTRITNDINALNELYSTVLVSMLKDVCVVLSCAVAMLSLNWKLALITLLLMPLVIILTWQFRRKSKELYRECRRKLAALNSFLQEYSSGMRVIQLFSQQMNSIREFARINNEEYIANMRQLSAAMFFQPLIAFVGHAALALVLYYGANSVIRQELSLGTLAAFVAYVNMFFSPIRELADKYNLFLAALVASERIFMTMDENIETTASNQINLNWPCNIEFKNVWFAYNDNEWILKDVSFSLAAGSKLALVGPTGSGKSSIVALLLGFYRAQKGEILIDGHNISDLDINALRKKIAVVPQDVFLFSDSLLENLVLHNSSVAKDKARQTLEFIAHTDVAERLLSQGSSDLGERGHKLSQGERQLLALARALIFDPKVLIMDEATANIDSYSESLIQEALSKILVGRSALIIAHRLSTAALADQIIVLNKGEILERGTHAELLRSGKLYPVLYNLSFAV